jgi:hypothetical protein
MYSNRLCKKKKLVLVNGLAVHGICVCVCVCVCVYVCVCLSHAVIASHLNLTKTGASLEPGFLGLPSPRKICLAPRPD